MSEDKNFIAAPSPNDALAQIGGHRAQTDDNSGVPAPDFDKPPRARVSDVVDPDAESPAQKLERKRDYLDGFLKQQPADLPAGEPGGELYEAVVAAMKEIYDPEIPVNIYDLGLIYGIDASQDGDVVVTMTLTTPHCPVAETMPGEVELRAASVPGVRDAEVNLVWDPPWGPDKMTDEARLELGML